MIRVIIFDLDDTLYDFSGVLFVESVRLVEEYLVEEDFDGEGLMKELLEIFGDKKDRKRKFIEFLEEKGSDKEDSEKIVEEAFSRYYGRELPSSIKVFDDVYDTLDKLRTKYKLYLVSEGDFDAQKKKVEILELSSFFEMTIIVDRGNLKKTFFEGILKREGCEASEILVVGDSFEAEITEGNDLGFTTVQMLHGRHMEKSSEKEVERSDYKISKISEIADVIEEL